MSPGVGYLGSVQRPLRQDIQFQFGSWSEDWCSQSDSGPHGKQVVPLLGLEAVESVQNCKLLPGSCSVVTSGHRLGKGNIRICEAL